jgi:hypothetical protein
VRLVIVTDCSVSPIHAADTSCDQYAGASLTLHRVLLNLDIQLIIIAHAG